jgi:hypothetical protein
LNVELTFGLISASLPALSFVIITVLPKRYRVDNIRPNIPRNEKLSNHKSGEQQKQPSPSFWSSSKTLKSKSQSDRPLPKTGSKSLVGGRLQSFSVWTGSNTIYANKASKDMRPDVCDTQSLGDKDIEVCEMSHQQSQEDVAHQEGLPQNPSPADYRVHVSRHIQASSSPRPRTSSNLVSSSHPGSGRLQPEFSLFPAQKESQQVHKIRDLPGQ